MSILHDDTHDFEEMKQLLESGKYKFFIPKKTGVDAFFRIVKTRKLAEYLASQQVAIQIIPVINVIDEHTRIIPDERDIVTIMDISAYYGVDVDTLYQLLQACNFDSSNTTFVEYAMRLKEHYQSCIELSDTLGIFSSHKSRINRYVMTGKGKTLLEIAKEEKIPFTRLYEEFLNYRDVDVAINEIRKKTIKKSMMLQYQSVIDDSVIADSLAYERYFAYLREQTHLKGYLINVSDDLAQGIYLGVEEFYKLMLINAKEFDDIVPLITASDRELFDSILKTEKDDKVYLTGEQVIEFLSIVSEKRLTIYENTKIFMELLARSKSKEIPPSGFETTTEFSSVTPVDAEAIKGENAESLLGETSSFKRK